jgi:hypothetical protein
MITLFILSLLFGLFAVIAAKILDINPAIYIPVIGIAGFALGYFIGPLVV